jgi:hypothetical protein
MNDRFHKVDNPLTIIAIFSGITEVVASAALPFLGGSAQSVFVWFLFLFPFALVGAFFATLNFNPRVLYAPGDYKDEKHFLAALSLSQLRPQVTVTSPEDTPSSIETSSTEESTPPEMSTLEGVTEAELEMVNAMFGVFSGKARDLFEEGLITGYSFGFQGDGLFLLSALLPAMERGPEVESRILRASTQPSGVVELHIAGRPPRSSDHEEMANMLFADVRQTLLNRKKADAKGKQGKPNK